MKNTFLLPVTTLLLLLAPSPVLAKKKSSKRNKSDEKSELKQWEERKKKMKALQLKMLIEENHRLKTQNKKLAEEVTLETMEENDIPVPIPAETSEDETSQKNWGIDQHGHPFLKGILFKVQIGAYKERDLSKVLEKPEEQEAFEQSSAGGLHTYTIRHFRNYWKADAFKKELRAMGVKETWIVAFKDGERVSLKEVLETIQKDKG